MNNNSAKFELHSWGRVYYSRFLSARLSKLDLLGSRQIYTAKNVYIVVLTLWLPKFQVSEYTLQKQEGCSLFTTVAF